MPDRSTRAFWAVGLLVAAVLVTLWLIVRERPLQDWWIALLLYLVAVVLMLWGRTQAATEIAAEAPSGTGHSPVREYDVASLAAASPSAGISAAASADASSIPVEAEVEAAQAAFQSEPITAAPNEAEIEPVVETTSQAADLIADAEVSPPAPDITPETQPAVPEPRIDPAPAAPDISPNVTPKPEIDLPPVPEPEIVPDVEPRPDITPPDAPSVPSPEPDVSPDAIPERRDEVIEPVTVIAAEARETTDEEERAFATFQSSSEPADTARVQARRAASGEADDLKLVEGIGPKMENALHAAGILTFEQLANASEDDIRAAVQAAGMRFAPSIPTWARQARFAADGDFDGLKAFQDTLTAGRDS